MTILAVINMLYTHFENESRLGTEKTEEHEEVNEKGGIRRRISRRRRRQIDREKRQRRRQ